MPEKGKWVENCPNGQRCEPLQCKASKTNIPEWVHTINEEEGVAPSPIISLDKRK